MPKMIPNFDQLSKSEKKESRIKLIMISFLLVFTLLVTTAIGTWVGTNKVFEVLKRIHTTGELIFSLDRARLNTLGYVRDNSEKYLNEALNYIEKAKDLTLDLNDHNEERILVLISEYRESFLEYVAIDKERKAIIAEYADRSNLVNNHLKMVLNFNYAYRNPSTIELINSLISDKTAINKKIVSSLTLGRRLDTQQLNEAIDILKNIKSDLKELIPLIKNTEKSNSLSKLSEDTDFYIDIVTRLNKNNYAMIKNAKEAIPSVLEAETIILSIRDERINSVSDLKLTSYLITLLTLLFFTGMVMLAYLIYHSLKSLVRLTHEATLARDEAISSTKIKSQFLANMSHEIRTPMNAIMGMTGLALKTNLDEKQQKYIESIDIASNQLIHIINDILDTSKIESGKFTIELSQFDLKQLLNDCHKLMSVNAHHKGLSLNYQCDENVPKLVKGDSLRLNQVLLNIVGNGIKFCDSGYVSINVSCLENDATSARVLFEITDTGIGISAQDLDDLFKPFAQVDNSTARLYGGTGLGLMISKQLVELMGGSLHVISTPNRGSTFSFDIPLGLTVQDAVNHDSKIKTESPKIIHQLYGKKILLVEDNYINQELVKELLLHIVDLEICGSGEQALLLLRSKEFDGVLMDCQLPLMDGYQTTSAIRNDLKLSLPIIAMTANVMPQDKHKAIESGMNDLIAKPLNTEDMYSKMITWFSDSNTSQDPTQAPSSQPLAETSEFDLPEWLKSAPHIDHISGLKVSAGNVNLYLKLLDIFAHDYEGFVARMGHADEIHKLKGTAGNLGATRLQQACDTYEYSHNEDALNDINSQLSALLLQIRTPKEQVDKTSTEIIKEESMQQLIGHVLIVEDDIVNQLLLKNQLKELGLSSDVVNDGNEALSQLQNRKDGYDLIITDIHMPNLSGPSLAKAIKEDIVKYGYINIVGSSGDRDYQLGDFPNFDELILKPFDAQTIHNKISKFLISSDDDSSFDYQQEIEDNFTHYSAENKIEIYNVIISSMTKDLKDLDTTDDVRSLAHKIKGSANMLGISSVSELAQSLQNEIDTEKSKETIERLELAMTATIKDVKNLLTKAHV
ncbi:response regulator [Vibrio splendidus]|uniref:response regulator n=1 Tax=Vibrio TaxID=662 RepID=UPI000C81B431|nr:MULTISPECIES: response regulator [Vibrio]MBO7911318.1 response regulator [Vibrio sp. G41H]MCF7490153.1 response regulator [Vibrio sp. G-C-1]MCT4350093.1 response regulator [Vibrio sp. NC2]MDH5902628.1 response regulator [Vibrio splendidus]MDH5913785.1 response regulator [Vibrio splendidus]